MTPRSDRLENEVGGQERVAAAAHDGAQDHGFERNAVVIGEVTMRLAEGRKIIGISSQKRPLVLVRVATWLCRSHSWPSVVWAQIWTRRCAKGIPSPARRTVPNIQKPPPPMRSTIGAPVRH